MYGTQDTGYGTKWDTFEELAYIRKILLALPLSALPFRDFAQQYKPRALKTRKLVTPYPNHASESSFLEHKTPISLWAIKLGGGRTKDFLRHEFMFLFSVCWRRRPSFVCETSCHFSRTHGNDKKNTSLFIDKPHVTSMWKLNRISERSERSSSVDGQMLATKWLRLQELHSSTKQSPGMLQLQQKCELNLTVLVNRQLHNARFQSWTKADFQHFCHNLNGKMTKFCGTCQHFNAH